MPEFLLKFAEILSTAENQIALIAFALMVLLFMIFLVLIRLLNSFIDYKREEYKAGNLPDRGEKGKRYPKSLFWPW